jgi:hypothetical protein
MVAFIIIIISVIYAIDPYYMQPNIWWYDTPTIITNGTNLYVYPSTQFNLKRADVYVARINVNFHSVVSITAGLPNIEIKYQESHIDETNIQLTMVANMFINLGSDALIVTVQHKPAISSKLGCDLNKFLNVVWIIFQVLSAICSIMVLLYFMRIILN